MTCSPQDFTKLSTLLIYRLGVCAKAIVEATGVISELGENVLLILLYEPSFSEY